MICLVFFALASTLYLTLLHFHDPSRFSYRYETEALFRRERIKINALASRYRGIWKTGRGRNKRGKERERESLRCSLKKNLGYISCAVEVPVRVVRMHGRDVSHAHVLP